MGRAPGALPAHPNLILAACLTRPGEDPGGTAVRLLTGVRACGYPASFLGADRGYTQAQPERFHLPVRALGYSLVMDYKATELGRQANSAGALMVEGTFYCPAMPEPLVSASADLRHGAIDAATHRARIAARTSWRLVRKQGPDRDGYERFACPARGEYPHLCCPLQPASAQRALGKIPVLLAPTDPPKICTQSAVTIAPDIGALHRQDPAFGSSKPTPGRSILPVARSYETMSCRPALGSLVTAFRIPIPLSRPPCELRAFNVRATRTVSLPHRKVRCS